VSEKRIPTAGSLKDQSVTRLLQLVMEEQVDGSLTVSRGDVSRTLFFKESMIIYATSTENHDRLGEIFLAQGRLSQSELDQAFKKARRGNTLLGRILLVEGKISSQELFLAVTAQVVSILERMRGWRKGDFTFEPGGEPEPGTVLLRIPLSLYLGVEAKKSKPSVPAVKKHEKQAEPQKKHEKQVEPQKKREEPAEPQKKDSSEEEAAGGAEEVPEGPGGETLAPDGTQMQQREDGTWAEVDLSGGEEREEDTEGLVEEITFHVQEVRRRSGRDAHELLGVHAQATENEIHDAYRYLAKLLHPDGHPEGTPEDISREAADLFREVSEAYRELGSPRKSDSAAKSRPSRAPFTGRGTPAPEEALDKGDETRNLYYRAKDQMAKGNYWQATDALRHVVRRKPREAMYRNLLGFCLMQTGRRLHEAEEHIREAIRLDPGNPDYLTNLGLVYKAGRFHSKARNMFQQALLYDRRHKMARQELKAVIPLVDPGGPKPLWRKIFGK
jgi:curved DNA-binding protein CbpA